MPEVLWKMPLPTTSLVTEPRIERGDRRLFLTWTREANPEAGPADVRIARDELRIIGTRAYKYTAASACTLPMLQAYDTLVDLGETAWLEEVSQAVKRYTKQESIKLRHIMIFFDDSACYEFIAESFEYVAAVESRPAS